MTSEELQRLSRAALINMILHQQSQIEELRTALARLKVRVAELEAQREHFARTGLQLPAADSQREEAALIEQQRAREQATRDALRHLDDVAYLAQSKLAEMVARVQGVRLDGPDLHQALYRAIEALKTVEDQPRQLKQQLGCDILRLTYVERKRGAEVAWTLAISERQYYRELKAAIRMVADRVLGSSP